MSEADQTPDSCHCCEGVRRLTPDEHANRPGLSALAYRVGTHGSFKATMQARIGSMPALGELGTRADADFTIALLDAWATVTDVLSFYTERIANEGFLRTATEFRSIHELARSIGYKPHPGVAAGTYLAFTVEDSPGAAESVPIPAGTRAQSSPDGNELPQTFETTEALLAHPEWNALKPRQTVPQLFNQDTRDFYFAGTDTRLSAGDWMLLRAGENEDPEDPGPISNIPLQVVKVEPNHEKQHTRVELVRPQTPMPDIVEPLVLVFAKTAPPPPSSVFTEPFSLSAANAATLATAFTWSADDRVLFEVMHSLPRGMIARYANRTIIKPKSVEGTAVFAMRVTTAPFGHNAPKYTTLPPAWINLEAIADPDKPYSRNWDESPPPITFSSNRDPYKTIYGDSDQDDEIVLLDAVFPEILPGSWVLLKSSGVDGGFATLRVTKSERISRADFALNAEVTALTLEANDDQTAIDQFHLRTTAIYAQSKPLTLAGRPLDEPVQGDTIELDNGLENPIHQGQPIIVSGTPTGLEDIVESELAIVKEAFDERLVFQEELQRKYRRNSVRLNANVALATHGESQKEILGGGDASQPFQTFQLSHAPLTYVSAPVPGGAQSTLELRVNGMLWEEAANLIGLGPDERRYVLRRDEKGNTTVAFGDGHTGGRLPTSFENVSASYRSGLGVAGNLVANKISLLSSQPRWVQAVTNPVPATGGADPESSTDTRRNAPNSVHTFGRIVSLQDFEDFAHAFGGVSKAKSSLLHLGEAHVVHVTIAGENGALVPTDSELYRDLVAAMNRVRDPFQRLLVASYEQRRFDVVAKVRAHADYQSDIVFQAIEKSLRETFSFDRRELGQGVALSEVMATMQRIQGVEAIDLDHLRFSHEKSLQMKVKTFFRQTRRRKTPFRLPALSARRDAASKVLPAQHLSIFGIYLSEMS